MLLCRGSNLKKSQRTLWVQASRCVWGDPPPRQRHIRNWRGRAGVPHVQHRRLHSDHTHNRAVNLQPPAEYRGASHLSLLTWPPRPSRSHPTHCLQSAGREGVNLLSRCSQAKRLERVGFRIRPFYVEFVGSVYAFTSVLMALIAFFPYYLHQLCQTSLKRPKRHLWKP